MEHAQHSRPLLLGVLAGSFSPAILAATLIALSPERSVTPVLPTALAVLLVSISASAIVGLPVSLWLRSREKLTAVRLCVAGVIAGAIVMAAFGLQANYWPQMNDQSLAKWIAWHSAIKGALSGATLGAVSSIAFCFGAGIVVRSR